MKRIYLQAISKIQNQCHCKPFFGEAISLFLKSQRIASVALLPRNDLLFLRWLLPLFLLSSISFSQQYPRWFLFPGEVQCSPHITIITTPPTYYRDSAIVQGFKLGCDLLARYAGMQISGGQTFWATEAGISSMGAKYEQHYDTLLAGEYLSSLAVMQSYVDKQKTLVLVGDSSCPISSDLTSLISLGSIRQPQWVEELPVEKGYQFGVGFSEEFYYEISSWQVAEKNAYMALARSTQVKMQSLQKQDAIEGQDIRNEEVNVNLQNVEIGARWKDMKKKIFYVLARMKK